MVNGYSLDFVVDHLLISFVRNCKIELVYCISVAFCIRYVISRTSITKKK